MTPEPRPARGWPPPKGSPPISCSPPITSMLTTDGVTACATAGTTSPASPSTSIEGAEDGPGSALSVSASVTPGSRPDRPDQGGDRAPSSPPPRREAGASTVPVVSGGRTEPAGDPGPC
jgi:hypothetical protein